MSRKSPTNFDVSLWNNNDAYLRYLEQFTLIGISMFKWVGVPKSINQRYLENSLFLNGSAVYFKEPVLQEEFALDFISQGRMNIYGEPILVRAYSRYNNFQLMMKRSECALIYNNYTRTNTYPMVANFARRLWFYDRIIDVNVNAQKTPILIKSSEPQRLTMKNLYKEYDGNSPVIFGSKDLDDSLFNVLKTDAPFVADKIYDLKVKIWCEALTFMGVDSPTDKKERLVKQEALQSSSSVNACRWGRLKARQDAAKEISDKFGHEVSIEITGEAEALAENYMERSLNYNGGG